jgi:hypothetical protein
MKEKNHKIKIKDRRNGAHITIIIGSNEFLKQYCDKIKLPFEPVNNDGQTIQYFDNGISKYIIYLRKFGWSVSDMSILVHELLHLVFMELEHIGFRYSKDSEEEYTYYLASLVQESFWKLRKLR